MNTNELVNISVHQWFQNRSGRITPLMQVQPSDRLIHRDLSRFENTETQREQSHNFFCVLRDSVFQFSQSDLKPLIIANPR